jgi:hypothetical protein
VFIRPVLGAEFEFLNGALDRDLSVVPGEHNEPILVIVSDFTDTEYHVQLT